MLIKVKRGWELPESAVTPEDVFMNRRDIVKALGIAPALAAAGSVLPVVSAFAAAGTDSSGDQNSPRSTCLKRLTVARCSKRKGRKPNSRPRPRPWEMPCAHSTTREFSTGTST